MDIASRLDELLDKILAIANEIQEIADEVKEIKSSLMGVGDFSDRARIKLCTSESPCRCDRCGKRPAESYQSEIAGSKAYPKFCPDCICVKTRHCVLDRGHPEECFGDYNL